MTNSTISFKPVFASTFESMTDDSGYLINQDELSCQEVCDNAIAIFRSSKDLEQTKKTLKENWGLELPGALEITVGNDGVQCFWISPDEFWIIHSQLQKEAFWQNASDIPETMS